MKSADILRVVNESLITAEPNDLVTLADLAGLALEIRKLQDCMAQMVKDITFLIRTDGKDGEGDDS